jgi:type II secretory pathway predicted ATPase ExeA
MGLRMAKSKIPRNKSKEKKGIAWYIPPALRHWLNSHAEYLSAIGHEISTDAMVVKWLSERVKTEERNRSQPALEKALDTDSNREGE